MDSTELAPLKIQVAPDIVEHLGLNLYTNLPRVLVEFVANAHDADSPYADMRMDANAIGDARRRMRLLNQERKLQGLIDDVPLAEQYLPSHLRIVIEDRGHGMTRDDLENKFLRIARKRRKTDLGRSPGGRVVMGRKGIGKLAAFGAAHRIEVISRAKGESHATQITLNYKDLIDKETTVDIEVEAKEMHSGFDIEPHGTRITLSELVYEPTASQESTIVNKIAEHFSIINRAEFEIRLNGTPISPHAREFVYAHPRPDIPADQLIDHTLEIEPGEPVTFSYRVRFTGQKKQLDADERGARVYAHQRLASAPSLLNVGTGMHGFQNTHYLDAIVRADFIDERPQDYIASDRQTLRWDTPLLSPIRDFLRDEMTAACIAYQGTKADTTRLLVRKDEFTQSVIDNGDLPAHRKEIAYRIAAKLAEGCSDCMEDDYYRETLPVIVRGLGYGDLLATIAEVADKEHPSFPELVQTIAQLTHAEWDDFSKIVVARLRGIEALRRIYDAIDFNLPKNEDVLHQLLRDNPWLIDSRFWGFLTSNETEQTLAATVAQQLQIGKYVPEGYDSRTENETGEFKKNDRPDLTFLMLSYSLSRLVIVELKAPNTPLHVEHLLQLKEYMTDAETILRNERASGVRVEGYLIGKRAPAACTARPVKRLRTEEEARGIGTLWEVLDIRELLQRAEESHREFMNASSTASKKAAALTT